MGLMNLLVGRKAATPSGVFALQVDLGSFKCGQTAPGARLDKSECYANSFDSKGIAKFDDAGVELRAKDGVLDYVFITLDSFTGGFFRAGLKILINNKTTPDEIISRFGPPYWTDNLDEETILFYEFQNGQIELQFEFPDKRHLGFVTLMRNGVLSKADQRKAYRVTREWPPK
jgi:hypothetical protein